MKRKFILCLTVFSILCLIGTLNITAASAASPEILEKAKKEGKVIWYTTMPGNAWKAIKKAFEDKYPIKLEVFRAGSHDITGRYKTEISAGRTTADCIHIADIVFFIDMLKQGNLMFYDSPEFKAYTGLPYGWVYPGTIVPLRVLPIAALVNTKFVDWKSIKSYDDMLDPKYKGMVASGDVAGSSRAYVNYYGLRGKYGTKWYEKLKTLNAQYYESSEKAMTQCMSGEWPILFEAWVYKDYQGRVLKKGPIHSVFPKEGSVVVPAPNAIMKQATHPNAAKVFQDFIYSKDGQMIIREVIGVHSGHKDVPGPPGMPKLADINVIIIDYVEAQQKRQGLIKEWQKLAGR